MIRQPSARRLLAGVSAMPALLALLLPAATAGASGATRASAPASPAGAAPAASIAPAGLARAAKHATPSARSLIAAAQSAMRRQRGVQELASVAQGKNKATITIRAGSSRGDEVGKFDEQSQKGNARVVDIGQKAYLNGDKNGLVASGFTTAAAGKEAGKWIAVPGSSSYGKSLAAGLTVSSASSELDISGPQHLPLHLSTNKRIDGTAVNLISTSSSGETVDLYLRASGSPLPVELRASAGSALTETITFSHWGSAPSVSAPRSSVSLKTSWLQSGAG